MMIYDSNHSMIGINILVVILHYYIATIHL